VSGAAFDLTFPATSANLGPCFDAAALALDFGLRVRAERAAAFAIAATGRDAAICGGLEKHLILEVYRETLAGAGVGAAPALALRLENQIPIGRGCGSSAAARLAGVALAAHFGELGWSAQRVFEAAARLEGHPDNAAACWWGGVVVSAPGEEGIRWLQAPVAPNIGWAVAVAAQPLATEEARAVLPAQYPRAAAVRNLQNALLLIAALREGRGDLLADALADRWHQPYRARLCPLLPALQGLAGRNGIWGCALSGAGPSVLLALDASAARPAIATAVEDALRRAGLQAELIFSALRARGAGMEWR